MGRRGFADAENAAYYIIDANAARYIKLISNLSWNVSFYANWDNQPPQGFSGSDYGTSSGLTWTFGIK